MISGPNILYTTIKVRTSVLTIFDKKLGLPKLALLLSYVLSNNRRNTQS